MRRVGVVTVGRSDYGIYRPVLERLAADESIELMLFVGGAHLSERFGATVREIEADGFPIAARVDVLGDDDSPLGVARALGDGVREFASAFSDVRPDILVVLGDRPEMLAAALAALPQTIPLAHIHGGELTLGAIDDAVRHALTKLSHLHFPATALYAHRIVQMGEEPWRVVVSGAPALDAIAGFTPLSEEELAERGVRLRGPTLVVTHHPVTLHADETAQELEVVLDAVQASGFDAVLTYPNADAGHRQAIEAIERLGSIDERFTVVRNLGSRAYYSLLTRAAAVVGNSSSGVIEAASFRLPVVDVGDRQAGRLRPRNVLHANPDRGAILRAIAEVTSKAFRDSLVDLANPYGDGHASERIVGCLASVDLDARLLLKQFQDTNGAAVSEEAGTLDLT